MGKLQPARGTRDIFGEDARRMEAVTAAFEATARTYGFQLLATPIFEFTEVFARPLGESSDIVTKEMYSFSDRGGEAITLRPEFTAGVARAFISAGMQQSLPVRLMSHGPVFRYERPQKGRYRQFHQINAEFIGSETPETDVEMITMAWRLLEGLDIDDKVTLHLNTLGDRESRTVYRDRLVTYFGAHKVALSQDSQRRLDTNPMRILDSKDEGDRAVVEKAPPLDESLTQASRDFYARVEDGLGACGVPFTRNTRLVRGLDYYTHTAFEFITDALGAQGTVIGGGRYDGLIEQLGGPPVPGMGWAGGLERLSLLLDAAPSVQRPVVIMPMGDAAIQAALSLAEDLRAAGNTVIADRTGNLKKRLTRAAKAGANHAVILGEDELAADMVTLRDLDAGDQESLPRKALTDRLAGRS